MNDKYAIPVEWADVGRMFHQDFFLIYDDLDVGLERCAASLGRKKAKIIKDFIDAILAENLSESRLRKIWSASGSELYISQGLRDFFQMFRERLAMEIV